MYCAYILKSKTSARTYVGVTGNIERRLKEHNNGAVDATANDKPFNLVSYIAFIDRKKAYDFERYLKTASGRSFLKKRVF
ncbi:GIY-YIG nuclease family protein [bacterium]|nr:GIY-YIG nuclease family protein [bacterium]